MPYKQPPLKDDEIAILTRWVKEGATFDGPSAAETPLASLVDVLAGLPKVALKVPAADAGLVGGLQPGRPAPGRRGRPAGRPLRRRDEQELPPRWAIIRGPSTSVRFTPDGGSLIAAGGRPGLFGSVTVWDVAKRQKRLDVRGHSDAILAAEVAPDGKILATAGYDKQILIWDLATGKVVRPLKDHSDAVYGLAFSPDGKTLASCAADRTVKLWDWATGRRTATLSESTAELYAVAFTPDGSRVLAGRRRSVDPDVAGPRRGRAAGRAAARAIGLRARRADPPAGGLGRRQAAGLQRRGPDGPALGLSPTLDAPRVAPRPGRLGRRRWRSARTASGWRSAGTTDRSPLGCRGAAAPRRRGAPRAAERRSLARLAGR